jgi:hypothetical protein
MTTTICLLFLTAPVRRKMEAKQNYFQAAE